MAQRIEEVFQAIAPSRRRGIPNAPPASEGIASSAGDLAASLSQAGREIAQLRAAYQRQADLISANTQAVQNNTSSHGSSAASTAGNVASSLFGGALGLISPIVSGIAHLFGGGASTPVELPVYQAPQPVSIDGTLRGAVPAGSAATAGAGASGPTGPAGNQTTYAPRITVNVNAMDSQSFMDRSSDIASAVREAMLNNHPINGVVADL
jgi:hypothetical protein